LTVTVTVTVTGMETLVDEDLVGPGLERRGATTGARVPRHVPVSVMVTVTVTEYLCLSNQPKELETGH
jgi:hypothetical protein